MSKFDMESFREGIRRKLQGRTRPEKPIRNLLEATKRNRPVGR